MRSGGRALAGVALAACACSGQWPASMAQQPSIRPLEEARPAPVGSIPVGGVETLVDREDVAEVLPPYPLGPDAAARGRAIFALHCTPCHGPEGKGDGPVSKKFPEAPNLRHSSICKRSDGFLYGTLTAGGRAMPTMRDGTTSRDRWDTVAFVRSLQASGCISAPAPAPSGGAP